MAFETFFMLVLGVLVSRGVFFKVNQFFLLTFD